MSEIPLLTVICKALFLLTDAIQNSVECSVYTAPWILNDPMQISSFVLRVYINEL